MPLRVPTTNHPSEVERWRLSLLGDQGLIPKVIGAIVGNLAEWTTGGVLKDSGISGDKLARLFNYKTITAAYSVQATDGTIFVDASGGNIAITMITAASLGGETFNFKRKDDTDNSVTIIPVGLEEIDTDAYVELFGLEVINLTSDDVDWWINP